MRTVSRALLFIAWPLGLYGTVALGIWSFINVGFGLALAVALVGSVALTLLMKRVLR